MGGLAKDRKKMDAFKADPHGEMTKAGISESDQLAVLSRKPELINKALGHGNNGPALDSDTTVVVVVL